MKVKNGNGKRHATQQSVNSAVKAICDIMRRSNCAAALQYVPELTWILFLRILDERETRESEEAEAANSEFTPSLAAPYRWQDWAAPDGAKRKELQNGALGAFFGFVNGELIPLLKKLRSCGPGSVLDIGYSAREFLSRYSVGRSLKAFCPNGKLICPAPPCAARLP